MIMMEDKKLTCPLCNSKLHADSRLGLYDCENADCIITNIEPFVINLLKKQIAEIKQKVREEVRIICDCGVVERGSYFHSHNCNLEQKKVINLLTNANKQIATMKAELKACKEEAQNQLLMNTNKCKISSCPEKKALGKEVIK